MTPSIFRRNLVLGQEYEEKEESYLRSLGYLVWNIGTYRLCADLYAYKGRRRFWVQVKYRNTDFTPSLLPWVLKSKEKKEIFKAFRETKLPFYLVVYFKEKRVVARLDLKGWKIYYTRKDDEDKLLSDISKETN